MRAERFAEIREVLEAVRELPREQWDEALASRCGEDDELRVQVERLLDAHERAGDFLEAPASPEPALPAASQPHARPPRDADSGRARARQSLTALDFFLLLSILPLWLFAFGLHVKEALGDGLAQPGIFTTLTPSGDAYPRVAGFRLELGQRDDRWQIDDVLISAGGLDLRGLGHVGLDAALIEAAGNDQVVTVVRERSGVRTEAELELARPANPWMRIPAISMTALVAVIVLLRAGTRPDGRLFFVAFMALAALQTPFHGAEPWQTYLSKTNFYTLSFVAPALLLFWGLKFPPEAKRPPRSSHGLPILYLVPVAAVRGSYFLGGPLDPNLAARLAGTVDALLGITMLSILLFNYRRSTPIGQRRVKWLLVGLFFGTAPLVLWMTMPLIDAEGAWYSRLLFLPVLATVAIPLSVLIAVVRQNLYDIDRLLSAAAAYSAIAVAALAGLFLAVPAVSSRAEAMLGLPPTLTQVVLSVAVAGLLVAATRFVRPRVERLFFPQFELLEREMRELLTQMSSYTSEKTLLTHVARSLRKILGLETSVAYARSSARAFEPVFVEPPRPLEPLDEHSPVIAVMRGRSVPLIATTVAGKRRTTTLTPFERATLEELRADALLPVRAGQRLRGLVGLGPKESADTYTAADVAWLTAVSDRLSVALGSRDEPGRERASEDPGEASRVLVDRYEVKEEIGRGGMGTVVRAFDRALRRNVALKFVREDLRSSGLESRFLREGRAMAAFVHSNVVTVFDFGFTAEDTPFLVMELLEGETVADRLVDSGRLPREAVVEVVRQTCSAITAAHARGILHRDLKPANLFLVDGDDQPTIKVLDFGIAKLTEGTALMTETSPGALIGTPAYMAPERLRGGSPQPSWDLWAVSVTAHQLLTGDLPFAGESATELRDAILDGRRIAPHGLEALSNVEPLFDRLLAPEESDRPQSAAELAEVVETELAEPS